MYSFVHEQCASSWVVWWFTVYWVARSLTLFHRALCHSCCFLGCQVAHPVPQVAMTFMLFLGLPDRSPCSTCRYDIHVVSWVARSLALFHRSLCHSCCFLGCQIAHPVPHVATQWTHDIYKTSYLRNLLTSY